MFSYLHLTLPSFSSPLILFSFSIFLTLLSPLIKTTLKMYFKHFLSSYKLSGVMQQSRIKNVKHWGGQFGHIWLLEGLVYGGYSPVLCEVLSFQCIKDHIYFSLRIHTNSFCFFVKGFVKVSSPSQHVLTDQPRTRAWDFRNSTGSGALVRGWLRSMVVGMWAAPERCF